MLIKRTSSICRLVWCDNPLDINYIFGSRETNINFLVELLTKVWQVVLIPKIPTLNYVYRTCGSTEVQTFPQNIYEYRYCDLWCVYWTYRFVLFTVIKHLAVNANTHFLRETHFLRVITFTTLVNKRKTFLLLYNIVVLIHNIKVWTWKDEGTKTSYTHNIFILKLYFYILLVSLNIDI